MAAQCSACGSEYPPDLHAQWGKTIGVGGGPTPKCVSLVNNSGDTVLDHLDVASGVAAPDPNEPLHTCGGAIIFTK